MNINKEHTNTVSRKQVYVYMINEYRILRKAFGFALGITRHLTYGRI
jgi:hypothetical protein